MINETYPLLHISSTQQNKMSEEKPRFQVPLVHFNSSGWGPTTLPEKYVNLPYAPFGKSDRLGKAADFTATPGQVRWRRRDREPTEVNEEFQYKYDVDEDESFNLVDTVKSKVRTTQVKNRWRMRPRRYVNPEILRQQLLQQQTKNKGASAHNKYDNFLLSTHFLIDSKEVQQIEPRSMGFPPTSSRRHEHGAVRES